MAWLESSACICLPRRILQKIPIIAWTDNLTRDIKETVSKTISTLEVLLYENFSMFVHFYRGRKTILFSNEENNSIIRKPDRH